MAPMTSSPLLMINPLQQPSAEFFSFKEPKPWTLDNSGEDPSDSLYDDLRCVGSSHGWLAFTHHNSTTNPNYLFNPISKAKICLPSTATFPDHSRIDKLILCRDPSDGDNSCIVLAMHTAFFRTRVSFCRPGDDKWADLGSKIEACHDVVCFDLTRFAFVLGPGPIVEIWNMSGDLPILKTVIRPSSPSQLARDDEIFPGDLYYSQLYLALGGFGRIYLVVRYIGEFVRHDGEVVCEGDIERVVCPYKTVAFRVFKYENFGDENKWETVESLKGHAIFLGGNQTTVVETIDSDVKGNAIYYTDHYWDRMDEDYSYGGHDMGVFNMEDGSIHPVLESPHLRIVPPPLWFNVS